MNTFYWLRALGFGALIWLILFMAGIVASALGADFDVFTFLVFAIVAGLLSYGFAVGAEPLNSVTALAYGLVFVLVGLVLDNVIGREWQPTVSGTWSYWLSYALILFAPFLGVDTHTTAASGTHFNRFNRSQF